CSCSTRSSRASTRSPSSGTRPARCAASTRRSPSTSTTSSSARGHRTSPATEMSTVRIPPTLRPEVGGARQVEATGATVREVLDDLTSRYGALKAQLFEDEEIAPYVNVYVEGEDVRTLDGLDTAVRDGATVILLPAIAA